MGVQSDPKNMFVALPVMGPIIGVSRTDPSWSSFVAPFAGLDAAAQAAGLGLLIAGLATRKHTLVRNDIASTRFVPVPMAFGRAGAGFGLAGMF
jgi:hypothetical protein